MEDTKRNSQPSETSSFAWLAPQQANELASALQKELIEPFKNELANVVEEYEKSESKAEKTFETAAKDLTQRRSEAERAANEEYTNTAKKAQTEHDDSVRALEVAHMHKMLPISEARREAETFDEQMEEAATKAEKNIKRHGFATEEALNLVRSRTGLEDTPIADASEVVLDREEVGKRVALAKEISKRIAKHEAPVNLLWPDAVEARIGLLILAFFTASMTFGLLLSNSQQKEADILRSFWIALPVFILVFYIPLLLARRASRRKVLRMANHVQQLRSTVKSGIHHLRTNNQHVSQAAQTEYEQEREKAEKANAQLIDQYEQIRRKALNTIAAKAETEHREATEQRANALIALDENLGVTMSAFISKLAKQIDITFKEWNTFTNQLGFATAAWEAKAWEKWGDAAHSEFATQLGVIDFNLADSIPIPDLEGAGVDRLIEDLRSKLVTLRLPALVPFASQRGLLFPVTGTAKKTASAAVPGICFRLLANLPPGKALFTFIDPIGVGNNVASLMSLKDDYEPLVNSFAWSEPNKIVEKLSELTEQMTEIIQHKLRNKYASIHDYNRQSLVAEPHRFVVVFDFPVNFTEDAARRLVSIAQNGPRCGVHVIVIADTAKPVPYGFSLKELEPHCLLVQWNDKDSSFHLSEPALSRWPMHLDRPPSNDRMEKIKDRVGKLAREGARVEVPYEHLMRMAGLDPNGESLATTEDGLEVPLGPHTPTKPQTLVFGKGTTHHGLIVGQTGSGKSNLMHIVITTLALKYSPEELELYLIDFKQGVEFKCYATHRLPHAYTVAVETDREFALSVMERLEQTMKRRGELFTKMGVGSISEYRAKVGKTSPMSRILLIVDEFQEFFREDDEIARRVTSILNQLVLQGRSNGIHILLGTQSLANAHGLTRGTSDQMRVRIALQCSDADSRLILADDNPAARNLAHPGQAIYNDKLGLVEGNHEFQVAKFSESDRENILSRITERRDNLVKAGKAKSREPILFAGNELAHLEACTPLRKALSAATWSTPSRSLPLWLGEPVAIRDTVCARLVRQSGSHLLVLARDFEAMPAGEFDDTTEPVLVSEGASILTAALLSAVAQRSGDTVRITIANFLPVESPASAYLAAAVKAFPNHPLKVLTRQREVAHEIRALAAETRERSEKDLTDRETILFFMFGLQDIKILRETDDSHPYEDKSERAPAFLEHVIREGSEVGIHFLASCDTLASASRVLHPSLMSHIGLRVATELSQDDSSIFLDSPAAAKLYKRHRAIFFDETRPSEREKFIPFGIPPLDFLAQAGETLSARD